MKTVVLSGLKRVEPGGGISSGPLRSRAVFLGVALVWSAMRGAWAQQPLIDDFDPKVGNTSDKLLVVGSGFSVGTIKVYFWRGVPASSVVVRSDSTMDVTVPSGAGTGPLGVQRDFGSTNYTAANFTRIGSGPYISSFTPLYGPTNQLVVLNGVHFGGVTAGGVKFNGRSAVDASVNSDGTLISVHVPYGATTGPISVTTPLGTSNSPAPFTVLGPGPFITGFSPTHGTPGTTVLIDGLQLLSATNAGFGGKMGVNFAVQSATLIRVDAPTGLVSGPVTVYSPLGNSTSIVDFLAPPAITNFTPAWGRPGTNVTVTGVNFRGATALTFNGVAAVYSVVDNTTIQAAVPATATTGLIRVTTPNFSAFSTSNFLVQPTITGFTPMAGPVGTTVVITGANFNVGTPVVRFNGVQAAAPTGVSFGQLTTQVPGGATTGPISVTTPDGGHTNGSNFFLPATLSGFSPTNSAPGTTVTITGLNFLGTTNVLFNGAPAPAFSVSNNGTILATVPSGVTTGPLTLLTPAGAASSGARLFYAAPLITGFAPTQGLPGTNVAVVGTNFLGARAVRFNGLAAEIRYLDNGQLTVTVPDGAQTGPITVEAPAGTNTTAMHFVIDYWSNLEVWMTNTPAAVTVGSNLQFSITMVNRGPFDAVNARWTNTFPQSVVDSVTLGAPWNVGVSGSSVVATCASAIAGGTSTMLVRVRPQTPGDMVATASLWSDNPDPSPGNNTYSLVTRVAPLPILSIRWWTNQVRVGWPVGLDDFLLEANSSFPATGSWRIVTNVPAVSEGQQFIFESNSGPARVYRLKK